MGVFCWWNWNAYWRISIQHNCPTRVDFTNIFARLFSQKIWRLFGEWQFANSTWGLANGKQIWQILDDKFCYEVWGRLLVKLNGNLFVEICMLVNFCWAKKVWSKGLLGSISPNFFDKRKVADERCLAKNSQFNFINKVVRLKLDKNSPNTVRHLPKKESNLVRVDEIDPRSENHSYYVTDVTPPTLKYF